MRMRICVNEQFAPPLMLTNVLAGGGNAVGAGGNLGEVQEESGVLDELVLGEIHLQCNPHNADVQ